MDVCFGAYFALSPAHIIEKDKIRGLIDSGGLYNSVVQSEQVGRGLISALERWQVMKTCRDKSKMLRWT